MLQKLAASLQNILQKVGESCVNYFHFLHVRCHHIAPPSVTVKYRANDSLQVYAIFANFCKFLLHFLIFLYCSIYFILFYFTCVDGFKHKYSMCDCVCTGIVVMTDGVVGLPDSSLMQLLLQQLHRDCISCSFIQLDRTHHMQRSFGFVPHPEFMQFIAVTTSGTYFPTKPRLVSLITWLYFNDISIPLFYSNNVDQFWLFNAYCGLQWAASRVPKCEWSVMMITSMLMMLSLWS